MAQASISASEAHTMVLLARSEHWSRGVRTSDGLAFVLFSGSTGQTYMTTERGCTCRGHQFRGQCAHAEAVRREADQARARAFRRLPTYADLFPCDDLEDAF